MRRRQGGRAGHDAVGGLRGGRSRRKGASGEIHICSGVLPNCRMELHVGRFQAPTATGVVFDLRVFWVCRGVDLASHSPCLHAQMIRPDRTGARRRDRRSFRTMCYLLVRTTHNTAGSLTVVAVSRAVLMYWGLTAMDYRFDGKGRR